MSTRQQKELIDLNVRVAIAFGLAVISLLLLYALFFR